MAIHKPRREASKKSKLLTYPSPNSAFQNCEKVNSYYLATQFVVLGQGSPGKLIQSLWIIVVTPSSKAIYGYSWFSGPCWIFLQVELPLVLFTQKILFVCLFLSCYHCFKSLLILLLLATLTLYPFTCTIIVASLLYNR